MSMTILQCLASFLLYYVYLVSPDNHHEYSRATPISFLHSEFNWFGNGISHCKVLTVKLLQAVHCSSQISALRHKLLI